MGGPVLEIIIVLVLVVANGVFSMSETAIIAARKARLQRRAEQGDPRAKEALRLAEEPNQFLSTVQIGITLIGILAGAFGGAALSRTLGGWLRQVPALAPYSGTLSFVLVVGAITYLSLVIGELLPKRLALISPERIASAVAGPMEKLSRVASPAVRVLGASTDGLLRLLGVRESDEPPVTEDEIRIMISQATRAGVLEEAEREILERVFRAADLRVRAVMTSRKEIAWLDLEDSEEILLDKIRASSHSRLPVAAGSLEDVRGVVYLRDIMSAWPLAGREELERCMAQAVFVSETMRLLQVLERFKQSRMHLALVVDEYGAVSGLVTLTDVLEALVGDIPAHDEAEAVDAVRRDDGSWLLDGMLPVDEVREILHLHELPGQREGLYDTLGGFIMHHVGRIPAAADHFELDGWRFEVADMDGHRVDKVLAAKLDGPDGPGSGAAG